MNPYLLPALAILLLAAPAAAAGKRCPRAADGTILPGCQEKPEKPAPFIQQLVPETDNLNKVDDHSKHTSSEVNPPPVASEQGAFRLGRSRIKPFDRRSVTGKIDGEDGGDGEIVELPDGEFETEAGDPPEQLLQKLEEDKQRALAGCAERPMMAERCRRRAQEYFGKVAANIKNNPQGNASLKIKHLELGWQLWQADSRADWLKQASAQNPAMKDRYEQALQQRDQLMHKLHETAGATAFHVVIMEEVNKEPQPGAGDSYRDWVRKNRRFPGAWIGMGQQQMREGDAKGALESLNQAVALDPQNADAFSARAAAHFKMGNIRQAYEDAVNALRLNPTDKSAFATLKLTEGRVGGAGEAVAGATAGAGGTNEAGQSSGGGFSMPVNDPGANAALLTNTSPEAIEANRYNALARRAMQVGDRRAALEAAQKSLSAHSANPFAYGVQARYAFADRDYKAALAAAEAGLKVSPKDRALLSLKSRSANRLRDAVAAAAAAEALLALDGADPEGLAGLAHARGLAGDRAAMDALLAKAARADGRYQVSVETALQMPDGSDMLFLFPGEDATETLAALRKGKDAQGAPRRFGVVAVASLIGGLLIGLGLLSSMAAPLTQRLRSAFTRVTSPSPVMRAEDRAVLAPVLEMPQGEAGLLRGQYRIKRQIGAGGMGLVFEGEDVTLGRRVAVKKMRDELRLDRRERQRFVNEAKVVAALHHANIVDIYAIVEDNEDVYLVFEYVKGQTVHDLIGVKGALAWREAMGIFRSMTAALEFAHGRNIIHRDLKPSNVMVDDEGYVKVMDFGIARVAKDAANKVSMTNTVVGTPPYMAPEQEQGVVRKESDVYALAICLYEMLTGKMPFVGVAGGMLMNKINMNFVKPSAMVSGLPAGIDEVFAKAFQADPDKRYATAKEMLAALSDLAPATRPDSAPTSLRNLPGENS